MSGVVVGGWEYVWAAYGITTGVLVIYGWTLITRVRELLAERGEETLRP